MNKTLAIDALTVLSEWMEEAEPTRLRRLHSTQAKQAGWSCELFLPESHRGSWPLREPWRWYHKGRGPYFCVECGKRMSHCSKAACAAEIASRLRKNVDRVCAELSHEVDCSLA